MRLFALITAALLALATLTACNTVRGMGQDIKKGGEALEKAAK
jgi:predicted small secreted protein